MKVQVTQENLSAALASVGRVAGSRTSLPILANVLIKTEGNQLQLAATNLEIAITELIGAKVDQPGSVTVPARLVSEFISSLPSGNVELELKDNKLHISSSNYQSTINGTPSDDFPSIPELSTEQPIMIDAGAFKTTAQQTVVAASKDDARPVYTGVYFYTKDGDLFAVATDTYRLAERKLATGVNIDIDIIVPARTVSELQRLATDSKQLELVIGESQLMARTDNTELVSKLIDGKFTSYRHLISEKSDVELSVEVAQLLNITKVAALFARESAGSITLEVSEADGTVKIASVASQVGENESEVPAKATGSGSVTLNSRFLIDALNVIEDDEVSFSFSGSSAPCVLRPLGGSKDNYVHIIMPLRS